MRASAETSFRFSVIFGGRSVEFGKEKVVPPRRSTGAYDPRGPKGYSTTETGRMQQRLIGKDYYRQKGDRWFQFRTSPTDSLIDDVDNTGLLNPLATVEFVDQFAALKKAGTVTKTSATSYAFGFAWKPGTPDRPAVIPVAGTIQVDPKSGLVTAMSYDYTLAHPKGDADAKFYNTVRWTYSGHGLPVDVKVPAHVTKLLPRK
ncbi:hypothetical protein [Actinoplanes sp. NPDC026623]|uniref:hypothetical protein n=1 Tax=Actinoplanes sp. NPDC026623 TaxID=3155610 RepID=UPI0033E1DCDD